MYTVQKVFSLIISYIPDIEFTSSMQTPLSHGILLLTSYVAQLCKIKHLFSMQVSSVECVSVATFLQTKIFVVVVCSMKVCYMYPSWLICSCSCIIAHLQNHLNGNSSHKVPLVIVNLSFALLCKSDCGSSDATVNTLLTNLLFILCRCIQVAGLLTSTKGTASHINQILISYNVCKKKKTKFSKLYGPLKVGSSGSVSVFKVKHFLVEVQVTAAQSLASLTWETHLRGTRDTHAFGNMQISMSPSYVSMAGMTSFTLFPAPVVRGCSHCHQSVSACVLSPRCRVQTVWVSSI
jgi:hypothetical protein